ncbi:hypothetical protein [Salibacterium aidingense]|uniref:hypothetical protein n=1 Tax=Salibacterium aidingense TaxID=384933 RepID=UPI003BC4E3C5
MLRFEKSHVLPFMIETIDDSDGQASFKLLQLWEKAFPVYRHQEKDLLTYEREEEPKEVFSDFGKEILNEEERQRLVTNDSLLQYAERTVSIEVLPAAKKESSAGIQKEEDEI